MSNIAQEKKQGTECVTYMNIPIEMINFGFNFDKFLSSIIFEAYSFFHLQLMSSFYIPRSEKGKKTVLSSVSFCAFGFCAHNSCS